METVIITRTYFNDATLGIWKFENRNDPVFYTIERPWVNNKQNESCIHEGEYLCQPYSSPKYPNVWEVLNVKDRSAILIHAGNWASDVKGCIAVGQSSGYLRSPEGKMEKAVHSSGATISQLRKIIGTDRSFKLIIR